MIKQVNTSRIIAFFFTIFLSPFPAAVILSVVDGPLESNL
jgi:hypothetical protein